MDKVRSGKCKTHQFRPKLQMQTKWLGYSWIAMEFQKDVRYTNTIRSSKTSSWTSTCYQPFVAIYNLRCRLHGSLRKSWGPKLASTTLGIDFSKGLKLSQSETSQQWRWYNSFEFIYDCAPANELAEAFNNPKRWLTRIKRHEKISCGLTKSRLEL